MAAQNRSSNERLSSSGVSKQSTPDFDVDAALDDFEKDLQWYQQQCEQQPAGEEPLFDPPADSFGGRLNSSGAGFSQAGNSNHKRRESGDSPRDSSASPPPKRVALDAAGEFEDVWDRKHVKLPCSSRNTAGRDSKWEIIQNLLLDPIPNSRKLEDVILQINPRYRGKWSFAGLHDFFNKADDEYRERFFESTLPAIAHLALQLPLLCKSAIPLLRKQEDKTIMLSQQQIACLLANAFFCTFPKRNYYTGTDNEYEFYPTINFSELFMGSNEANASKQAAKLRCIFTYFECVTSFNAPNGKVSFHRQVLRSAPDWQKSTTPLQKLEIRDGAIEDTRDMLQVDFANKMIGGGVLGRGAVQEEIRFLVSPELIASRLFVAELDDNECVIIIGAERYSNYSGYGESFAFTGAHVDDTPRDELRRRKCYITAVDALLFTSKTMDQYLPRHVERELNKAYCGFLDQYETDPAKIKPVATGHWGCGVFGGNRELKCIIQLMSASEAKRKVIFFPYEDQKFRDELISLNHLLSRISTTVGEMYTALTEYHTFVQRPQYSDLKLFDYLLARWDDQAVI